MMNQRRSYNFSKKSYTFGFRELLLRMMVINLEDGFVHPGLPVIGWMMMVCRLTNPNAKAY